MEVLVSNDYIFNLTPSEGKNLSYISNSITNQIKNRIELEKFTLPIIINFFRMLENKTKSATLDVYFKHDEKNVFIGFIQYKLFFKDNEKGYEVFRLSKGVKWRRKYKHIKMKVDILFTG